MNFKSVSSESISVKFVQIYGQAEFQKIVQNQNRKIRWIELNELGFGVVQAVKKLRNDYILSFSDRCSVQI